MLDILQVFGLQLLIGPYPQGPLGGLALTLVLSVLVLVLSFPLAVVVGVARVAERRGVALAAAGFTNAIRGLPLLLVVFWSYYALPFLFGASVRAETVMVAALTLYESAYLGEIVRAGLLALPAGQSEAARALGLGRWTTLRKVLLPQALFNMIPSFLNQFIVVLKNTSVAYVIGVNEVTNQAYQINSQLLSKPFEVFAILAAIYFGLARLLGRGVAAVERRMGQRGTSARGIAYRRAEAAPCAPG